MRKLMKCRFCGGTEFWRASRTTAILVKIQNEDDSYKDEVVGNLYDDDTTYDYKCKKCGKESPEYELDDLLR